MQATPSLLLQIRDLKEELSPAQTSGEGPAQVREWELQVGVAPTENEESPQATGDPASGCSLPLISAPLSWVGSKRVHAVKSGLKQKGEEGGSHGVVGRGEATKKENNEEDSGTST